MKVYGDMEEELHVFKHKELDGRVHALATSSPSKYTSVTVSATPNLDTAVEREVPSTVMN